MSLFVQCSVCLVVIISLLLTQCHCYMVLIITPLYHRRLEQKVSRTSKRLFPLVIFSTTNTRHTNHNDNDLHYLEDDKETDEIDYKSSISFNNNIILSRRYALGSLAASIGGSISTTTTTPLLSTARAAAAAAAVPIEQQQQEQQQVQQRQSSSFNVKCLVDLPPIPNGFVRVYLCRHGQTENNRLNLMQGARVDPAINDTGMTQAQRLGMALVHAADDADDGAIPNMILHSKLRRAQQTAQIASQQFASANHVPKLATLDTLGEVDFGEIAEGLPVDQVRTQLIAMYAGWATGNLDLSMPGGESGRQVLNRVESALQSLLIKATSSSIKKSRCIGAVTHSTYLRMLLAVVQEQPLLLASTMEQKNCCINVLDIKTDGSTKFIGPNSRLFTTIPLGSGNGTAARGGPPADFGLTIPVCQVLRINEKRHLGGLV